MSNPAVFSMSFAQMYPLTSGEDVFQVGIKVCNQSSIIFLSLIKGWSERVLTVAPIVRLYYYKMQQILGQSKKHNGFLNIFLYAFAFTQAQQFHGNDHERCTAMAWRFVGIFYQIVKNNDILSRLAYVRKSVTSGNYICY